MRKRHKVVLSVAGLVFALLTLASLAVFQYQQEEERQHGTCCNSNLKMIDIAKEEMTRDLGLVDGDSVTEDQSGPSAVLSDAP